MECLKLFMGTKLVLLDMFSNVMSQIWAGASNPEKEDVCGPQYK